MRFLLFAFLLVCISGFSSNEIDSLERILPKIEGKEKSEALNRLSFLYSELSFEKAYNYSKKANEYSNEINYPDGMIKSYINLGVAYHYQSNFKKAEENMLRALKLSRDNKIPYLEGRALNGLGVINKNLGQLDLALEYYQKALKIEMESGKEIGVATIQGNIGIIYSMRKMYDKAKEHHYLALEIQKKLNDENAIAQSYGNLGLTFMEEEKYKDALDLFEKALKIYTESNDNGGVTRALHNMGETYMFMGKYDLAYKYLNESFEKEIDLGNQSGAIVSLCTLANLFTRQEKYPQAISYLKNAIDMAEKIDAIYELEQAYNDLYQAYNESGDFKNALAAFIKSKELSDTIFNMESEQRMLELETIYETEKKDRELSLQKVELKNKNKDIERQKRENEIKQRENTIIYIVLILIGAFSVVLFIQIRAKMRANRLLKMKNEEILQQKEEIETQRDEIESQNDLLHEQKSHIETINKSLTDSIIYAKRIQTAVLPSENELKKSFPEHFVFYRPKDIVSGDFYWIREIEDKTVFAVADCTGHGVPGGFMSMLGISLLNEIVDRNRITSAPEILNRLREQVISSVGHSNINAQLGDGMDIVVCVIDRKTMNVEFSGANNSIYIVLSDETEHRIKEFLSDHSDAFTERISLISENNKSLIEIKGDKMPVGLHVNQNISFSPVSFNLTRGDSVYLSSDGFFDQFGGPDGRKYMQKRFKELLLAVNNRSMEERQNIIEKEFSDWSNTAKKTYEQTDDVLVVGFRLS